MDNNKRMESALPLDPTSAAPKQVGLCQREIRLADPSVPDELRVGIEEFDQSMILTDRHAMATIGEHLLGFPLGPIERAGLRF